MATIDNAQKTRVFLATNEPALGELRRAMGRLGLEATTLDEAAPSGTNWVDGSIRAIEEADLVIGALGAGKRDSQVFFELGVASALNKPTAVFVSPEYPKQWAPPSGIPYFRTDLHDESAVLFGLKQSLALAPRDRSKQPSRAESSRPSATTTDQWIGEIQEADAVRFEEIIHRAIAASGVNVMSHGTDAADAGVDFALWVDELEPVVGNPLLIDCKLDLRNQPQVDEVIGRMIRALTTVSHGFGIVIYQVAGPSIENLPRSLPLCIVSASEFLVGLRKFGLAGYVRSLRNAGIHGS